MLYKVLVKTDTIAGGRTIFPQIGISVKPVKGAALYWFNIHPDLNYDSRYRHAQPIPDSHITIRVWIRFHKNAIKPLKL